MRWLWHDLRTHRLGVVSFLTFWAATWWAAVVTWRNGLSDLALLLPLLAPFTAAILIGVWQRTPAANPERLDAGGVAGMLVGLLVMESNLAIWIAAVIMTAWTGGRPPSAGSGWLDWWGEVLDLSFFVGIIGLGLGALGGLIGGLLAAGLRHLRRENRPILSSNVSQNRSAPEPH